MTDETRILTVEHQGRTAARLDAVKRSPAHRQQLALGASFAREAKWEIPRLYGAVEDERRAVREGLGLADISARGKIDLRGSIDAAAARLPSTEDAVLARISRRWALVLTTPAGLARGLSVLEAAAQPSVLVTEASSIYAGFALVGPRVPEFLLRLTAIDPFELIARTCVAAQMLKVPVVLVRRDLPRIVVEAYLPSEYGRYAWESLMVIGAPLGVRPVGWDALRAEGWV